MNASEAGSAPVPRTHAPASAPAPVVLVLASGRGERFAASGGQVHKLAAPLAGKTVLERTVAAARASGLGVHVEDAGHPGMGDSIAAAVAATASASAWLVLPGDLPLIDPASLRRVADALLPGVAVVVPRHAGERGHPVAFAANCRDALMALRGDRGAASVLQAEAARGAVRWLDLDDIGIVTDIDTVQQLAAAEEELRRRAECQDPPDRPTA